MKEYRLRFLLNKLIANDLTEEEHAELMQFIKDTKDEEAVEEILKEVPFDADNYVSLAGDQFEALYNRIIADNRYNDIPIVKKRSYPFAMAVCAVLLLVVAGLFFYGGRLGFFQQEDVTLVRFTEKRAPIGKVQQLTFPDGTMVWLKGGSTLKYPTNYSESKREVFLDGEAYFEVAKMANKSFVVYTDSIATKVLGTSFNINSNNRERFNVVVATGKVQVTEGDRPLALLTPNRQLTYNRLNKEAKQSDIPAELITGWHKGELIFEDITMETAAEVIADRFNVKVNFSNKAAAKCRFSVAFRDGEGLKKVMEVLGNINNFKVQYHANTITINGNGCR